MSDDIVTRLRERYCSHGNNYDGAYQPVEWRSSCELCELDRQAADEIERLRKIIKDFYYEELNYQDAMDENPSLEYIIPQSWKDAYQALKEEATK